MLTVQEIRERILQAHKQVNTNVVGNFYEDTDQRITAIEEQGTELGLQALSRLEMIEQNGLDQFNTIQEVGGKLGGVETQVAGLLVSQEEQDNRLFNAEFKNNEQDNRLTALESSMSSEDIGIPVSINNALASGVKINLYTTTSNDKGNASVDISRAGYTTTPMVFATSIEDPTNDYERSFVAVRSVTTTLIRMRTIEGDSNGIGATFNRSLDNQIQVLVIGV